MFGVPCYLWIPARSKLRAGYYAAICQAEQIPSGLEGFEASLATAS
jgi:hypothetical protein